MNELVQVLTEDGKKTSRVIDKNIAHGDGICHGISAIGLINDDGKILLQKRVSSKKLEPCKWDFSGAGHIDYGEDAEDAAVRELFEELGIEVNKNELVLIDTFLLKKRFNDELNINHFTYLYIVKKDVNLDEIKINIREVSEVKYFDKSEYNRLLLNDETVEGMKYCNRALDYIR